jgi:wobble nucleotide-excising tRNase
MINLLTSVQPTVDSINRSLKAYGFEGFSITASPEDPNRYQIKRPNGDIVKETLSEGEETFISFLYFMYMTQGGLDQKSISQHKIIVVDDPICSLDSSILYVVSSMVRDLIEKAKKGVNGIDQIFVLTHNVYFHKEISFIDGRDKADSKTKFWVLKKKNEISFSTAYERKNPIKTTYALLWSEVKENSGLSTVSLQNAMRRILENFFGTIGNANSTTILEYFETVEEKAICRSLFSWANDGSHSIPDDLEFSENTDAADKYRKVFKDIFYKTHNNYHYDRMME